MNTKGAMILGGCIIVAALLHSLIGAFVAGEPTGRYAFMRTGAPDGYEITVLDTRTGILWRGVLEFGQFKPLHSVSNSQPKAD